MRRRLWLLPNLSSCDDDDKGSVFHTQSRNSHIAAELPDYDNCGWHMIYALYDDARSHCELPPKAARKPLI